MSNDITISTTGAQADIIVIQIERFLDAVVAYSLQEQVYKLIREGNYKYVIDLKGLEQLSSAGVGLFSGLVMELRKYDGRLIFLHLPEQVKYLFQTTGLIELFTIGQNMAQAIATLEAESM